MSSAQTSDVSERYQNKLNRQKHKQLDTIDNNPCFTEKMMSLDCTSKGGHKCEQYFDNFRRCKKFWARVVAERKRQKIEPALPVPSERKQVMEEYLHLK